MFFRNSCDIKYTWTVEKLSTIVFFRAKRSENEKLYLKRMQHWIPSRWSRMTQQIKSSWSERSE